MKNLCTCSWRKFFLYNTLCGREDPFFKGEQPILCESTLFIRETPFLIRLPFIFFGGGTGLRSLERALVFPVVVFEPGSTVSLNHARAGSKNCTVNSYLYIIVATYTVAANRLSCFGRVDIGQNFLSFPFSCTGQPNKDLQKSKMTYLVIGQVLYEVPFYESL